MLRTRAAVVLACVAFALTGVAGERIVRADESALDRTDELRLADGQTVTYPQTLYQRGRRYVGGVSYAVVDASVDELISLLGDMTAYTQVLPHARNAKLVGHRDGDRLVEITQGNAMVQAAYTLRMRTDNDGRRVRFWIDRSRPHGIDDAWGYFRVDPLPAGKDGAPRVLLSYGILVDLGPGLIRDFFEARIQASMLSVPERLRQYATRRFRARGRSSVDGASRASRLGRG